MFAKLWSLDSKVPTKNTSYISALSTHLRVVKTDQTSTEKEFRKYYGKKLTKMILKSKHSPGFSFQRCKTLKSFTMDLSPLKKDLPKSIKKFTILSYLNFEQKHDKNLSNMLMRLSDYKYLECLEIELERCRIALLGPPFFRRVRTLIHLQSLEVTLNENSLLTSSSQILAIRSLKILKLGILRANKADEQISCELYSKLIRSKTLTYLNLDLAIYPSSVTNLILQEIGCTSLPFFDINLMLHPDESIESQNLDAALLQADLFTLHSKNITVLEFACDTTNNTSTSLKQGKRKLHLNILTDDTWRTPKINATEPLKNVKDLFSYYMGSAIPATLNLHGAARLKSLELGFDSSLLSGVVKRFLPVLEEAVDLEHLTLFRLPATEYSGVPIYEAIFAKVSNLKNLQVLKIIDATLRYDFLETLSKPFQSLISLRKLYFDVKPPKSPANADLDFRTLFPNPCKLIDLDIFLPQMNSDSKIKFIKALAQLTELQKLTIQDGTQLFDEEGSRALLLEKLLGLTKLKEVTISEKDYFGWLGGSLWKSDSYLVAAELNHYVKSLFSKNKYLTKVYFRRANVLDINYEIY